VAQPAAALYADREGADLVNRLLDEAPGRLNPGGRVLAELDPSILALTSEAANRCFGAHRIHRDLGGHERMIETWSSIPTNPEPPA
jgi:methylase of polypeptide subunit release factors